MAGSLKFMLKEQDNSPRSERLSDAAGEAGRLQHHQRDRPRKWLLLSLLVFVANLPTAQVFAWGVRGVDQSQFRPSANRQAGHAQRRVVGEGPQGRTTQTKTPNSYQP